MKTGLAFLIIAASSYALSFAFDLLIGGTLGVYPATAFLPAITWSLIALVSLLLGFYLAPTARSLVVPPLLIAVLALLRGLVGPRYSLLVSACMFGHALAIWYAVSDPSMLKSSRLVLWYSFAGLLGIAVWLGIALFAGIWFPRARAPVFLCGSAYWLWVMWKVAVALDRAQQRGRAAHH